MAALKENYQQPAKVSKDNGTVAADSQVANCFKAWLSASNPHHFNSADTRKVSD
jgi:hypothetical protein